MTGTQISAMTPEATLPDGAVIPFVVPPDTPGYDPLKNYIYDLGADLLNRASYTALALPDAASLIGSADGNVQGDIDARPTSAALAAPTGAAMVGIQQTGANTDLRDILNKGNELVSVKDFTGVTMDGTNDSAGFANAVADGRRLLIPAGTLKIDTDLTLSADTLYLEGQGETSVLDFSGGGSLSLTSAPVAIPDLSADLAAGENFLNYGSAHGLAKGDVVILFNPTPSSFATFVDRPYYYDGAMFRIAAVPTSTTAVIYGVAHRSFTAANFDCYKMTGGKVVLRNLRIIPPSSGTPVQIDGHQSVLLQDLLCDEGAADTAIEIRRCFDFEVSRITATCNGGDAYPVVIVNSQVGSISRCSLYSVRHSISMGGGGTVCAVPCRDVTVSENTLLNDATLGFGAADCHGNCEDIIFTQNVMNAALNPSGLNITVTNNIIYGRPPSIAADGGCVYSNEVVGGVFNISGNTFYTWGDGLSFGIIHLGVASRNRDFTLYAHDNVIVSRGASANQVRMFRLDLGSTAGSFRVDTDIQGLRYVGSAAFSVLALAESADISSISSHIIDGLSAPSGTSLIVASSAANYNAPLRLQQLQGSVTLTATSGTERTIASPINLRYLYPRTPNGGATATGQAVGDQLPQGSLFSLSSTQIQPQIATASTANFNATADRVVSWWCGISDL